MPVYTCPRCGGPITDVAGTLQCPNSPCQYGHDEPRRLVPQTDVSTSIMQSTAFDAFWVAYPRKTAKAVAKKAWAKLKPDAAIVQAILNALVWQCQTKQWAEDNIIPHPATWLNQKRWEDEPPTALAPSSGPPPKPPVKSFKEQERDRAQQLRRQGVLPTQPPRPNALPPSRLPRPNQPPLPLEPVS